MINLNSSKYSEKLPIHKDAVLTKVNAYDVFVYYIGKKLAIGETINNPFRTSDSSPSLGLFLIGGNNIMYKDLGSGNSGDCFLFISQEVYKGSITYKEALEQVIIDFGVEEYFVPVSYKRRKFKDSPPIILNGAYTRKQKYPLKIKSRSWKDYDFKYWKQFSISKPTLKRFRVIPIDYYSFGPHIFKAAYYSYAYVEKKDGVIEYKVYQPFAQEKHLNGVNSSVHLGYSQLPQIGELLIITKSLKDVMSLYEVANIPSVSVTAESIVIKPQVAFEYKKRFHDVVTLFDNDEAGQKAARNYWDAYGFPPLLIPEEYRSKDPSDLVKNIGKNKAKEVIDNLVTQMLFNEISKKSEGDLPF